MEVFGIQTSIKCKDITQEQEDEFLQKIKKMLEDIREIQYCKELIDVVIQCENLSIIFDLESELVNNVAVHDYTTSELPLTGGTITIGAKLSSTRTKQDIKGILARELCLYALCLTYENKSHPFHKHDIVAAQKFNEIIKTISNWTSNNSDRCNGIISSVLRTSKPEKIQMELIAAVVQILVQFNDDKEELTRFEVKFKDLLDYFKNFVLPEMKNFNLKFRENVKKFTRNADILPSILSLKLELSELKDVKSLTENNFLIIQTNFPKLLLINIQKCLQIEHGNLFDVKNVFVSAEELESQDFQNLLAQGQNLNVFIIWAGKVDENLKNIFACKSSKFTLIVSDENQCQELAQKLAQFGFNPTKVEVNYGWNDLTVDSQKLLLKMKINFQNNSEFSFLDILKDEFNPEDEEVVRNFSEVVDDQLLSLMIEGSEVSINLGPQIEENLFQERNFIKKELDKYSNYQYYDGRQSACINEKMTKEEFVLDCQDTKLIVISDKPGSGKSLAMKNFAKLFQQENPTKWVTYVDMKQFTEHFKDQMTFRRDIEFPTFFAETILKNKTKFEAKIFQKMYELGKVFIFLDGLDELTPSCCDYILKAVKTFESNEGSQLWISICEPIEVDLEKVLELNVKHKFEEFSEKNCADLIANNWVLNEAKNSDNIKNLEKFESYQILAKDFLENETILKFGAIGMPQLCKMIAEITKDDKTSLTKLTELKIFKEFTQNLYKKFCNNSELDFWTFHELMAVKILFPNYFDLLDLNLDDFKVWTDDKITTAGLMTKNGENFDFLHRTSCDFFVAEFILKTLKQEEVSNWFVQFLLKVLTTRRYQCIRLFLNQGFEDLSELKLSDKTIKSITANIDEYTNISYVFMENLNNLGKFLVMCLNRRRYKVVKSIIVSNVEAIFAFIKKSENPINPEIFLDFLVNFLNAKCLQNLIKEKKLFFVIIESCNDIEIFENFANAVKKKINSQNVVQNFKRHHRSVHPNIFFTFCWSKNVDRQKIQKFFRILKGFLNMRKIMDMMKLKGRWNSRNVFDECIQRGDPEVLEDLWTEIENYYKSNESHRKFKELITNEASVHHNILRSIANSKDIKLHETFWELAVITFGQDDLMNLINLKDTSFTDYFLIPQISYIESPKIIEFTFAKLQEIFNAEQFDQIMSIKSYSGGNLILRGAETVLKIEVFQSLWNLMKNFCKSDEKFLELIKSLDNNGSNIINASIRRTDREIFDFIISELKILANREEIKSLLTNINDSSQNIVFNMNDSDQFETVWDVICEYLEPSEMLEILQNCDCCGHNFILNILYNRSVNISEVVWNAVKKFINQHEIMSAEVTENIEKCEKFIGNFDKFRHQNNSLEEVMKLKWLRTKNLRILDCPEILKSQITQSGLFSCAYDFYVLANCENFEIHEICWEFILKKYENREDLVKLMTKRSVHGSIFIHSIMSNKNIKIIEFNLKIIQNNFNEAQIREILTTKCSKGISLLSAAVIESKNLKIVQNLWEMHQKCFSSSELIDKISEIGENSSNILLHAAGCTIEIFNYIWSEINKLFGPKDTEKLRELIMQRTRARQSILHVCIEQHDVELLKIVWKKVKEFSGGSLKSFVKLFDISKDNYHNWYNDIVDIIGMAVKSDNIEFNEAIWELLWENFKEHDELRSLILWKNDGTVANIVTNDDDKSSSDEYSSESDKYTQDSDWYDHDKCVQDESEPYDYNEYCNKTSILSFLVQVFQSSNLNVIKLTMQNLTEILTKDEISKILICDNYSCFLDNNSNSIEKHEFLWDIYRQYLTVAGLKKFAHRFFNRAVCNSVTISQEIFIFSWNQAIKEAENVLIPSLETDTHIICACIEQKDIEILKIVWKEVRNFYKVQNLPESFKEFILKRNYSENIFGSASKVDDVKLHETLWELLLSTFENRDELKNILNRNDKYYGCLIGDVFKVTDPNVVNFLVKIFRENFTDIQLQELMSADKNMMQNCLNDDEKSFEVFKIWWEFFKNIFKTSEKFAEFLEVKNNFNTIFGNSNEKVLELMFNDLKVLTTREQIRKILLKVNEEQENILHVALRRGNDFGSAYKLAWQFVHKYLNRKEIYNLLTQSDDNKRNFLLHVVLAYSKEFIDITWTEMKKVLSHESQIKFLKLKDPRCGNVYQCASIYAYPGDEKLAWIVNTLREYKIRVNK